MEVWIKVDYAGAEVGAAEVASQACQLLMRGAAAAEIEYAPEGAPITRGQAEQQANELWSTAWLREWDNEDVRMEGGRNGIPRPDDCINVFDSRSGQAARHYYLEEVHEWTA